MKNIEKVEKGNAWWYLFFRTVTSQVSWARWTLLLYSEWEQVFPQRYSHQANLEDHKFWQVMMLRCSTILRKWLLVLNTKTKRTPDY